MDAVEWGVIEEYKADFVGNILISNRVLKMIKSRCNLTPTEEKKITIKNLVRETLLKILRSQEGGFGILMEALAKEEKHNEYFIDRMKTRLQQRKRNKRRLKNTNHHKSSNIEEDGVYVELLTTVTGVPNNTKPEHESLKSITDQVVKMRKDMDPQNLKNQMSIEELHRETLEARDKVHKEKIESLKRESNEKDKEIQKLSNEKKELLVAQKQLKIENSRLQNEKEKLRVRRKEDLMNIDADVRQPIVQTIITAKNVVVN